MRARSCAALAALLLAGCPGPPPPAAPPWEQRARLAPHHPVEVPTLEPVSVRVGDIDPTGHAVVSVADGPRLLAQADLREGGSLRFAAAGRVHELLVTTYELHRTHDDLAHVVIVRLPAGTPDPPPPGPPLSETARGPIGPPAPDALTAPAGPSPPR